MHAVGLIAPPKRPRFGTAISATLSTMPLHRPLVWISCIALPLLTAGAAQAQKEIPKAPGHDQCPLGYVNTLGTTCVSPIYYEVTPTHGEACPSGWMNIGAGYCKKKTLGIF